MPKLTKTYIDKVEPPASGYEIHWDDKVGGYGPVKPRGPGVMPWQKGHVNERRN